MAALPLSVIEIVNTVTSGEGGGGHWGGGAPKSYKKKMAPPLSVIKIVNFGGAKILQT